MVSRYFHLNDCSQENPSQTSSESLLSGDSRLCAAGIKVNHHDFCGTVTLPIWDMKTLREKQYKISCPWSHNLGQRPDLIPDYKTNILNNLTTNHMTVRNRSFSGGKWWILFVEIWWTSVILNMCLQPKVKKKKLKSYPCSLKNLFFCWVLQVCINKTCNKIFYLIFPL